MGSLAPFWHIKANDRQSANKKTKNLKKSLRDTAGWVYTNK